MSKLLFGFQAESRNGSRSSRRAARLLTALLVAVCLAGPALAFVLNYEAIGLPEDSGWERIVFGTPERTLEGGWFVHTLQQQQRDAYRYNIGGISGLAGRFFMEWRAVTDNPEWLIDEWQVPAAVASGGNAGVLYHVVMTESAAVLLRDIFIPRVIVPITQGAHTYRIEVFPDEYIWYIDGVVVDSGVPEGPYPDPNARLIWGAEISYNSAPPATTAWDYVRFGRIPDDASGDYDSDGAVTDFDYYFFHDCLTKVGPGIFGGPAQNAGPGCRFADFDADTAVDLLDFAEFANQFTHTEP